MAIPVVVQSLVVEANSESITVRDGDLTLDKVIVFVGPLLVTPVK
jgi:hypothetical protein